MSDETEVVEEPGVRPFADWLIEQANGVTHRDLTDHFNELVAAVMANQKGGDLTLSVKVKPAAKGTQTVTVSADVKVKLPRAERPESIFYVDSGNNVRRDNPNQLKFEGLRDASAPAGVKDLKEAK